MNPSTMKSSNYVSENPSNHVGTIPAPTSLRRTILPRIILVCSLIAATAAFGFLPIGSFSDLILPAVQAQNFGQRTIQGKVLDDREAEVGGATVFLKNLKSRSVKSFTSTPDGSFRFAQVGMVDDYEVWAEQGKNKSSVKTVSSYDSRKTVDFELKLK